MNIFRTLLQILAISFADPWLFSGQLFEKICLLDVRGIFAKGGCHIICLHPLRLPFSYSPSLSIAWRHNLCVWRNRTMKQFFFVHWSASKAAGWEAVDKENIWTKLRKMLQLRWKRRWKTTKTINNSSWTKLQSIIEVQPNLFVIWAYDRNLIIFISTIEHNR